MSGLGPAARSARRGRPGRRHEGIPLSVCTSVDGSSSRLIGVERPWKIAVMELDWFGMGAAS